MNYTKVLFRILRNIVHLDTLELLRWYLLYDLCIQGPSEYITVRKLHLIKIQIIYHTLASLKIQNPKPLWIKHTTVFAHYLISLERPANDLVQT